jgi:hypothetical protein
VHSGNLSVGDWYGEEGNLMLVKIGAERERIFGEPLNTKGGGNVREACVVCMIVELNRSWCHLNS